MHGTHSSVMWQHLECQYVERGCCRRREHYKESNSAMKISSNADFKLRNEPRPQSVTVTITISLAMAVNNHNHNFTVSEIAIFL